jgi:ABC-type branched-subunit amino acid transport system ATPase component
MNNPRLVLMDEPTEGLSPFMVDDLRRLIATLRAEGVGVLLVEQNLDFALSVADRVYIMERGRIVREATPEEVREDDTTKASLGL